MCDCRTAAQVSWYKRHGKPFCVSTRHSRKHVSSFPLGIPRAEIYVKRRLTEGQRHRFTHKDVSPTRQLSATRERPCRRRTNHWSPVWRRAVRRGDVQPPLPGDTEKRGIPSCVWSLGPALCHLSPCFQKEACAHTEAVRKYTPTFTGAVSGWWNCLILTSILENFCNGYISLLS